MKNVKASIFANDYAEAIEEKFNTNPRFPQLGLYKMEILAGRVYDRIMMHHGTSGGGVHVFVNRANGDLVKAASYAAPQKNSNGTPAVRYNISTAKGFEEAVNQAEFTGGYLYKR